MGVALPWARYYTCDGTQAENRQRERGGCRRAPALDLRRQRRSYRPPHEQRLGTPGSGSLRVRPPRRDRASRRDLVAARHEHQRHLRQRRRRSARPRSPAPALERRPLPHRRVRDRGRDYGRQRFSGPGIGPGQRRRSRRLVRGQVVHLHGPSRTRRAGGSTSARAATSGAGAAGAAPSRSVRDAAGPVPTRPR